MMLAPPKILGILQNMDSDEGRYDGVRFAFHPIVVVAGFTSERHMQADYDMIHKEQSPHG